MKKSDFEKLVQAAIEELPAEFREKLENVVILVEDEPTPELLDVADVPEGESLLGFYEGTPITERGHFDAPLHPDRIWLFQKPIEEICSTEEEVREEIRITVMHEVAHFFGMDDDYLEEIGY